MFNRRDFIQSGVFLTLMSIKKRALAYSAVQLSLNKTNKLVPGVRYALPRRGNALGATCLIEYKAGVVNKKPPVILAQGDLIMTQKEDLVIDVPGVYRVQYLGPSLGWHVI